ncbi:hypothetical protein MRB53_001961 [Persea americana]|uniref:Uncharacterized protein n=1 Tax=Persea americana TaxID=3435 RepID=A0ACC2MTI2_PERAE|nr:hypothetical protein MRB53_001961 [Persea americana]
MIDCIRAFGRQLACRKAFQARNILIQHFYFQHGIALQINCNRFRARLGHVKVHQHFGIRQNSLGRSGVIKMKRRWKNEERFLIHNERAMINHGVFVFLRVEPEQEMSLLS